MTHYEVWRQEVERDEEYQKRRDYYNRETVTKDLEQAEETAYNLAEEKSNEEVETSDDEYTVRVRNEKRGISAENLIHPLDQGQIVYSAECVITLPQRFDPVYRITYVVEVKV